MTQNHTPKPRGNWEKNSIATYGRAGHITNGRGIGFTLHGGTNHREKLDLCKYLDKIETANAALVEALVKLRARVTGDEIGTLLSDEITAALALAKGE